MKQEYWLYEITPKKNNFDLNLKEVWQYRDLLLLFVKRDVVTLYKQTILGPLWYLIQPLFTSIMFTLIFNNIAKIDTGDVPPFLFNLAGVTSWNYFSECLNSTSDTFKRNQNIFGKVYFPRIIMPLSTVISNLVKFGIQIGILVFFYVLYLINGAQIKPSIFIFMLPFMVLIMGMLGLGMGMIISSMVTKYRDLTFLVSFGVSLLMYVSLVNLPYQIFAKNQLSWVVDYNPMAHIIELSRFLILGQGSANWFGILYSTIITIILLIIGIVVFNRTEKNFIDTI